MNGAATDTVGVPTVVSAAVLANACVPPSAAANVYANPSVLRAGSLLFTKTVPRNPATGLPAASTAEMVIGNAAPAVTAAGIVTANPTAPARLARSLFPLVTTATDPTLVGAARSIAPSPLKSPDAATSAGPDGVPYTTGA